MQHLRSLILTALMSQFLSSLRRRHSGDQIHWMTAQATLLRFGH